jgi:hypothetical protein
MISVKIGGIIAAAFIAGAFVASPELRAYAANTVGSADIINESILSADIKNGEVKASDIATDAVGAAELQGVTKILFAKCALNSVEAIASVNPGAGILVICKINGVAAGDQVMATANEMNSCFAPTSVEPSSGKVDLIIRNVCDSSFTPGAGSFVSLIIYHK